MSLLLIPAAFFGLLLVVAAIEMRAHIKWQREFWEGLSTSEHERLAKLWHQ